MALAEILISAVAPSLAKTLLKLWAKDDTLLCESGTSLVDILSKAIPDVRARNETDRQLSQIAERAAETLQFVFDAEGSTIFATDRETLAEFLATILDPDQISAELLAQKDLDPAKLAEHLCAGVPMQLKELPPERIALLRRVLEEACEAVVDIAHELPTFSERTFGELLKRNRVLVDAADRILLELDRIRSQALVNQEFEAARFETEYRRSVARNLNKMELVGVDLLQASKSHPLSVAYVSLEVVQRDQRPAESDESGTTASELQSIESALEQGRRLIVRGPAGAGKTTLLRWIAVKAASHDFEGPLREMNDLLPFIIRLRHYANSRLPKPEEFPELLSPSVAGLMPSGWVHEKLRAGLAIVMIDGVDEIAAQRQTAVRDWIKDLAATFPSIRIIVTSRPHAIDEGWLPPDQFELADLQPMNSADIDHFIDHWHAAVHEEVRRSDEAEHLLALAVHLKQLVRKNRALRRLATSPLLCAVMCALHRDSNEKLPEDRLELYERCCSMLLERRDLERGLDFSHYPKLSYRQKKALLQDLAYWMIRNDWTEVARIEGTNRLAKRLETLRIEAPSGTTLDANAMLKVLIERSGLLREPVEGQIDFAHRTFQEYLAALAVLDEGDLGVLTSHALNVGWREVVVLACGLARPSETQAIISDLIARGDRAQENRYQLYLLAAACLEVALDLPQALSKAVMERVGKLIPPASMQEASMLATNAADLAVPFLRWNGTKRGGTALISSCCVRALGLIGSPECLEAIAEYAAQDRRLKVQAEVARAARHFEDDEYIGIVGPYLAPAGLNGELAGELMVRFGTRLTTSFQSVSDLKLRNPPPAVLDELRNFKNLSRLTLVGISVKELRSLRGMKLQELELKQVAVDSLEELQEMVSLSELRIEMRTLPSVTPVGRLNNLKFLTLKTDGSLDASVLLGARGLESLTIEATGISGLTDLYRLPSLRWLFLSDSRLRKMPLMPEMKQLRTFGLQGERLENLAGLSGLRDLQRLSIWNADVGPHASLDLSALADLKKLHYLLLDGSAIKDITVLAELPELRELSIWRTNISDLSPLKRCEKLHTVDFPIGIRPPNLVEQCRELSSRVNVRSERRIVAG